MKLPEIQPFQVQKTSNPWFFPKGSLITVALHFVESNDSLKAVNVALYIAYYFPIAFHYILELS